jgi:hypothetical protein
MAAHGGRKAFKGVYFAPPLRPTFAREAYQSFTDKLQAEPELSHSVFLIEFIDSRKIREVPLVETAFSGRGTTQNGLLSLKWSDPASDLAHRAWSREIQMLWKKEFETSVKQDAIEKGVPQYINYAERGSSLSFLPISFCSIPCSKSCEHANLIFPTSR